MDVCRDFEKEMKKKKSKEWKGIEGKRDAQVWDEISYPTNTVLDLMYYTYA